MSPRLRCPWCGSRKYWVLSGDRRRCARCRRDWRPGRWPLRLTAGDWRRVLTWFARGASSDAIAGETGLDRKRVLRALLVVRQAMADALAHVDPPARSRWGSEDVGADALPVIGIRFRRGHPTAEMIDGVDGRALARALKRHVPDLRPWEQALRPYIALVVRHRLRRVSPDDPHPPHGHAELGAFWHYLHRELTTRGGIRRERLPLYLAEYSWRYRWRKRSTTEVASAMLALIAPSAPVSPTSLWGDVAKNLKPGADVSADHTKVV